MSTTRFEFSKLLKLAKRYAPSSEVIGRENLSVINLSSKYSENFGQIRIPNENHLILEANYQAILSSEESHPEINESLNNIFTVLKKSYSYNGVLVEYFSYNNQSKIKDIVKDFHYNNKMLFHKSYVLSDADCPKIIINGDRNYGNISFFNNTLKVSENMEYFKRQRDRTEEKNAIRFLAKKLSTSMRIPIYLEAY